MNILQTITTRKGNYPVGTSRPEGGAEANSIGHSRRDWQALERDALRRMSEDASSAKRASDCSALSMWWHRSILRRVAQELGNFPRRILAIRCLPKGWGLYLLPDTPAGLPANSFLQSCSEYIRARRVEFRWVGYLDAQILGKAYAEGARWAFGIVGSCSETDKGS